LLIWQVGMDIVEETYKFTEKFPPQEKFGLTSQMRRAAVSIPSNISEGYRRKTNSDFLNFLHITFGSASELETQSLIAFRLNYLGKKDFDVLEQHLNRFLRLLNGFIRSRTNS